MTEPMWIAFTGWALLALGYLVRHRRRLHVPLMLSGILLDTTLVLYLEINRGAVETALQFELSLLQQLHIGASTIAFLLYPPIVLIGFYLLRQPASDTKRSLHRRLGHLALFFRTLGLLFMFSMLSR